MARRPARSAKDYRRGKPERAPRELVLIVCEGEKTEKNYLRSLCNDLKMSGASVTITPSHRGSDPVSVVTYAIERHKADDSIYARVYCVFDRDTHANFADAIAIVGASALSRKGVLHTALSVPCFEYWVLLHFTRSSAPFVASRGRSPCDNVVETIKQQPDIADYKKSMEDLYARLKPHTDRALANADHIEAQNLHSDSKNPSTDVHKLVRFLQDLAKKG